LYQVDEIAYADERRQTLKATSVRPLEDHKVLVVFSTGEFRIFDASSLLKAPAFAPLIDDSLFKTAAVDHGVVVWGNGNIDISTVYIYEHSKPVTGCDSGPIV
jgi:hypothetical protein